MGDLDFLHKALVERKAAEAAADRHHRELLKRRGEGAEDRKNEDVKLQRLLFTEEQKKVKREKELKEELARQQRQKQQQLVPDLNAFAAPAYRSASSMTRRPRIVLGVCLPGFLEGATVLQHVAEVHAIVCDFADVIVVLSEEASEETPGLGAFEAKLGRDSRRAQAAASEHGGERTQLLSAEDGRTPVEGRAHAGTELAMAIVQWADVLLLAPLSYQYLSLLERRLERDLLSAIAVRWVAATDKRDGSGGGGGGALGGVLGGGGGLEPVKPLIISPRLEPLVSGRQPASETLRRLASLGLEIMEPPAEEEDAERFSGRVAEHVRHGVMKAIGKLEVEPPSRRRPSARGP